MDSVRLNLVTLIEKKAGEQAAENEHLRDLVVDLEARLSEARSNRNFWQTRAHVLESTLLDLELSFAFARIVKRQDDAKIAELTKGVPST
jgi:hypothetical protein